MCWPDLFPGGVALPWAPTHDPTVLSISCASAEEGRERVLAAFQGWPGFVLGSMSSSSSQPDFCPPLNAYRTFAPAENTRKLRLLVEIVQVLWVDVVSHCQGHICHLLRATILEKHRSSRVSSLAKLEVSDREDTTTAPGLGYKEWGSPSSCHVPVLCLNPQEQTPVYSKIFPAPSPQFRMQRVKY